MGWHKDKAVCLLLTLGCSRAQHVFLPTYFKEGRFDKLRHQDSPWATQTGQVAEVVGRLGVLVAKKGGGVGTP
jgi:hypothetical protein